MRHVSRTHRVALNWLFDRINLDPKIQIRYIDTKHQIADILTKGNFTRDEWNNPLHLFNISHFSSLCCAQTFSLASCTKTMAKRMPEQKGEDRIVAKSKPTTMNLACLDKFFDCAESDCSEKPANTQSFRSTGWFIGKPVANTSQNSNPDAASSSQVWQKDAQLFISTGRLVATDNDQKSLNRHEKSIFGIGELVATGCEGYPEKSGNSRRLRRFGNRKSILATSFPYITK